MTSATTEPLQLQSQGSAQPGTQGDRQVLVPRQAPASQAPALGQAPTLAPLLTTRSIIDLAWGLTLNLSHEQPQRDLGKNFEAEFFKLLSSLATNREQMVFAENLMMAVTKTIRNMAFVRESHVAYLDGLATDLQEKSQTLKEISGITELTKQGLSPKIISFLLAGGGVIAAAQSTSPLVLLLSAAGGVAISTLFTFGLKPVSSYYRNQAKTKIEAEQKDYWLKHFKPDMTNLLYNLYLDIRTLADHFPGHVRDDWGTWGEERLKQFINNEILPPDFQYWLVPEKSVEPTASSSSPKLKNTS